jgi:hypothetical protein
MDVIALIKERRDALSRATRHVLIRVAQCTDVDGGIFENVLHAVSVTVDERSKTCAVFAGSEAGNMGSNPTQGMDI